MQATPTSHAVPARAAWLLAAGLAGLWLLAHPYTGIRHDGRLYLGLALAALDAQRLAGDLFFAHGAQDRYTLFPALYAGLISLLGVPLAAKLLLLAGQAAFVAAAAFLLRAFFKGSTFWLALAAICCLPGSYGPKAIFAFGEAFATARSLAEPLCLLALALLMRGRPAWAATTLLGAALMHPLMALPAMACAWLLLSLRDRRWWWLAAAAPLVFLPAVLGIAPFDGLLVRYDATWLGIVRSGLAFLFPLEWSAEDWQRIAYDALVLWLGWRLAGPAVSAWIRAVALVTAGGLLVAVLGASVLENVLLTSLQTWRALWLAHFTALALLPVLVLRLWTDRTGGRLVAALLVAAFLCQRHEASLLALLAVILLQLAGTRAVIADPRMERLALAGIGLLALTGLADQFSLMASQDAVMSELDARPLVGRMAAHGALLMTAAALLVARCVRTPMLAAGISAGLLCTGVLAWDQRPAWEKGIEQAQALPARFVELIGPGEQVYWRDELLMVWLGLGRPSYYSLAQGSSVTFNRAQALELDSRGKSLSKLRFQEALCGMIAEATGEKSGCVIQKTILELTCRNAGGLGHIVLPHDIEGLSAATWTFPGPPGSEPRTFHLYRCRTLTGEA